MVNRCVREFNMFFQATMNILMLVLVYQETAGHDEI